MHLSRLCSIKCVDHRHATSADSRLISSVGMSASQVAELASKPRCEKNDGTRGEVSALAQKFAEVENRMRGHLQTRLAKVGNHIKVRYDCA